MIINSPAVMNANTTSQLTSMNVAMGLEVHIQLATETKIFCGCRNAFGQPPNTVVCPVCMGLPGALPVLNEKAVEYAIKLALAMNGVVRRYSHFDRKNYFYPDLPKGYQITQYERPLCEGGAFSLEMDDYTKMIGIRRMHLEEDAGKSVHDETYVNEHETLIDFNRCGVPLLELVTEPELHSPEEAVAFLKQLQQLVRYLEISEGDMEKGQMRCDANISVNGIGQHQSGVRTELKNMNSFHNVLQALHFEMERQKEQLDRGICVRQQTLLWDAKTRQAIPMRSKDSSEDYRYFHEPDLPVVHVPQNWIIEIDRSLPELPEKRKERFIEQYRLSKEDANALTASRVLADYFEATLRRLSDPALVRSWVLGEVLRVVEDVRGDLPTLRVQPARLAELLRHIRERIISNRAAKTVFERMLTDDRPVNDIIDALQLRQISDRKRLEKMVAEVVRNHPRAVKDLQEGNKKILGFLVGQVMKSSKGKANPKMVNQILKEKLLN